MQLNKRLFVSRYSLDDIFAFQQPKLVHGHRLLTFESKVEPSGLDSQTSQVLPLKHGFHHTESVDFQKLPHQLSSDFRIDNEALISHHPQERFIVTEIL